LAGSVGHGYHPLVPGRLSRPARHLGGVAQFGRALRSQRRGRRFKSDHLHPKNPARTAGFFLFWGSPYGHDGHDAEGCRGQNRRRWRHSIHDWRHAAAVWQLFELRLDPEDVAQHLGHGDGYTLYQLYVGARPGRAQRAAKAVEELGDPRIR
jgi:integrase